jgi:hypothetical protein
MDYEPRMQRYKGPDGQEILPDGAASLRSSCWNPRINVRIGWLWRAENTMPSSSVCPDPGAFLGSPSRASSQRLLQYRRY